MNKTIDTPFFDTLTCSKDKYIVSFFQRKTAKSCNDISIDDFIESIKTGVYKTVIEPIRAEPDKAKRDVLKAQLPCITTSGIFNNSHAAKALLQHSGFLQIDIDNVGDEDAVAQLIRVFKDDEYTFCVFISPSGRGVKIIVKIDGEKHLESFLYAESYYLREYSIKIDESCKDVGRVMFVSYDPNIYVNRDSKVFPVNDLNMVPAITIKTKPSSMTDIEKTKTTVEHILTEIEHRGIDITNGYDSWLKIGFALTSEFGNGARDYFHRVSKIHSAYNSGECDKQFEHCLKSKGQGTTIKTFFQLAKDNGIDISNRNIKLNGSSPSQKEVRAKVAAAPSEIVGTAPDVKKVEFNNDSHFAKVEKILSDNFVFRYNEVANDVEFKTKEGKEFVAVNENNLYRFLQHNNIKFSLANLTALLRSDYVKTYNPFTDYFESLPKWNAESDPDYITKFSSYIIAKEQERFNKHFKKMFVRAVACALDEKKFNKQAFVLVHEKQNSGKSTLCRFLCPPALNKYFTESFSIDKDSLISLSENIFINLDELSTLSKIEINTLKSMFSKDKVKIRKPFEKKPTVTPRRCSFIGSTNRTEFLNDETGSVRWLCFEIESINWGYSNDVDINLVWAQAYALYKSDMFDYFLDESEISENETANEKHQMTTTEMDLVQIYLTPATKDDFTAEFLTATEILVYLQASIKSSTIKISPTMLGKALQKLRFERSQKYIGELKQQLKGYYVNKVIIPQ